MRAESRRARAVVDGLELPDPWDVRRFCACVARSRGRPIHLVAWPPTKAPPTATVMKYPHADYIFYRSDLSIPHRDHAVCHECAHLLLGHVDLPLTASLSELSDTLIAHVTLHRDCAYGDQREQDAESVADLIMERVNRRVSANGGDPVTQRIVRGFGDALR